MTTPASLKPRVFACLARLADRDTYSAAASELESIGRGLDAASIAAFVSCIHSTDASDRSTVRKQCVRLLAVLAESHGDDLSPHLNKILSAVVRRLRDNDSAVRSACVASVESLRRHVSKPPFSSFLKPLADALFTEQDQNSQIGAALCLAAAVEVGGESAAERIAKLMPRLERLLKCDGFKAKPAVLCLIGSAIGAGAMTGGGESALRSLVPCVAHFLTSEEWAARKAAAEALARLAVVERNGLSEFKAGNLKNFENRRFDKVKAVREVMNQLLEAWKQIPDVPGDMSQPQQSSASSKEKAGDGGSKNPVTAGSESRRKSRLPAKSTPPEASYARKRTPLRVGDKTASPSKKKPVNSKVEISEVEERDEMRVGERAKRALFQTRVAPLLSLNEESGEDSVIVVSDAAVDVQKSSHVEWEDLSLIRNQLVQIEKQQTSLMDLLQRFIGSSQNGMRSLETRVHGLELALDEISYDLAVTTGRVSKPDPPFRTTMCCMPGADFLSSKFWRRSDHRLAPPRAVYNPALVMTNGSTERLPSNRGFQLQGRGIIVNPLAERQTGSAMPRH